MAILGGTFHDVPKCPRSAPAADISDPAPKKLAERSPVRPLHCATCLAGEEMASHPLRAVVRYLSAAGGPGVDPTDRQLLERFAATRDEGAFAALVGRHGRLVWGVCRRALRHAQDAEDAFQATFLVLARRAASVRWRDSVANWLYGTASRVAAELRTRNARDRARLERHRRAQEPLPDAAARELCAALDEELTRLPEQYRAPLLLCYFEGRTSDQAARQLGWSLRTLERRLAQGRELLRGRLTRRGLTLPAALLTATFSGEALPADLAAATTAAAVSPGAASGPAAALAAATSKGMTMGQFKSITLAVLLAVGGGFAFLNADPPASTRAGKADEPGRTVEVKKGEPSRPGPESLARRMSAVMAVVQEKHVDPPARTDMTLLGATALLKAGKATVPDDLPRRAADAATEAQLADLLRTLWPTGQQDAELEAAALAGFLDGLPGRPAIHTDAQVKLSEQLRDNRYVGIGIRLTRNEKEQFPQIESPFRRGPARVAGARPGDLIVEIDGRNTKGVLDLEKIVTWLRGEAGTSVTVVVRQPGAAETRTLKLVRGVVPIDSVYGYRRTSEESWDYLADRDAGIAYVWVMSIKSSTLHELRQAERRLRADGAKALVLDFRFSAGDGNLHDVSLLADGLLDQGVMWSVRGKGDQVREYRADREALFRGWPLVALTSDLRDNCQAACLAALRDNDRAVLVGEPTANDGLVRSRFPLPGGKDALTLLTGRLDRAKGGWPLRPDHAVELDKEKRAAVLKWLTDKQLTELPAGTDDHRPVDPQLDRALTVLRQALKDGGK
jgi:C-terminal peptidase prc